MNTHESPQTLSLRDQRLINLSAGISTAIYGFIQVSTEAYRILKHADPAKFPYGWASFNVMEEFLEGSLPAAAGCITGHLIYHYLQTRNNWQYDANIEIRYIGIGSMLGYAAMAMFLGPLIHEIYGVPDVKWGPFK